MSFIYAECLLSSVIMLSAIMLSVVILSVIMLKVIMLRVIMLNEVILSVVMLSVKRPNFVTYHCLPILIKVKKKKIYFYILFSKAFSKRLYDKKWSSALMSTLPLPACFEMVRSKKKRFSLRKNHQRWTL
jgi:hypothetical protein